MRSSARKSARWESPRKQSRTSDVPGPALLEERRPCRGSSSGDPAGVGTWEPGGAAGEFAECGLDERRSRGRGGASEYAGGNSAACGERGIVEPGAVQKRDPNAVT